MRTTFHSQSPAQLLRGFADRPQADAGSHVGRSGKHPLRIEPHAIVTDAEDELAVAELQGHVDPRGPRVPHQVGERLLQSTVDQDLHFQVRLPG